MHIVRYKNINLTNHKILDNVDWSRKNNKNFSKLHSISSYLAMFSPSLPDYFIKEFTKENDLVMDNFSGRGTTALTCRETNRRFIGSDLNPYAFVLTRFKISNDLNIEKIKLRIIELEKEFNLNKINWKNKYKSKKYNELKIFYHHNVLPQLIFLREKIGQNWKNINDVDNAILAIALGLMHGQTKKDGTTIYFSLSMPNTISMSPNYVKKYSIEKKLILPDINIFNNIWERLKIKFDENLFNNSFEGTILFEDATKESDKIKDNSVSLVITSPPYLSIVDYRLSNWLKLWLLGYEKNNLNSEIKLSDKLKYDEYIIFIKNYLNSIYSKLKNNARVCLVVGDVHDKQLIEEVWKTIQNDVKYKFDSIYYDKKYAQIKKVTNMLNSKKGKATIIEKVLVLRKYEN